VTADIEDSRRLDETRDAGSGTRAAGSVVRSHLVFAAIFLVFSAVLAATAAAGLVWPTLFEGISFFSYGRLMPLATSAFLYGWLTLGFLAAVYYILSRMARVDGPPTGLAFVSLLLIVIGVFAGLVGMYLGVSDGRRFLEMPIWADAVVFAGLVLAAVAATRLAARSAERLGPPQWYLLAATWWLVLVYLAGNVPGMPGYAGQFQASFYRASLTGLWFAAAGVGIAYYLIPRLVGTDPIKSSPLTVLGFWSLAFVWAGTGPVDFIYGAGPDWLETLGGAFSIALLVPVFVIFTDLALAMRGRWIDVRDRVTLRFVIAGAALFALLPVYNLLLALRTSSAAVQFTEWIPGFDVVAFYGAFTLWICAFAYHALSGGRGPRRAGIARWHLRLSLLGILLAAAAMTLGGLATGFTWAAGANAGEPTTFGEGFEAVVDALAPYLVLRTIGLAIFVIAQILFLVSVFGRSADEPDEPSDLVDRFRYDLAFEAVARTPSWRSLRYGALILFLGAFTVTFVLPAFDPEVGEGTILGDEVRSYPSGSIEAEGRAVYVSEGCMFCHTQEVREIVPDVGLGPVSRAGDYVHENPIQRGVERLGSDLMHVGSREGVTAESVRALLEDPRSVYDWSMMPSYSYLSDSDLDALSQYIVSLR
jgi:cbb3-type cytochrome oxidase subunit 1